MSENLIRREHRPAERGSGVIALWRSLVRNRRLIVEMARREVSELHAGQAGGLFWSLVHPIVLFVVYSFLFTFVFKVRIGDGGPTDYLIYLFSGLAPWLLTQDIISRSPNILVANQAIVKKVMFPIEALVAKTLVASLVVQLVLLGLVFCYVIWARGFANPMLLLLPALLAVHIALLWGIALLLSSLTPYFRDLAEFVRVFVTINVYLMPVMYLPSMLPEGLRLVLLLNPFSHLVWCYQDVLYFGTFEHPYAWAVFGVLAAGVLLAGSYTFVRLRHFFANVL